MRIHRSLLLVAVAVPLLLLAACASRLRGEMSYDEHADFSRYKTFTLAAIDSGSPEARRIAAEEVRNALEAKGLRAVDAATADVVAHVLLDRRHKMKFSAGPSAAEESTSAWRCWPGRSRQRRPGVVELGGRDLR